MTAGPPDRRNVVRATRDMFSAHDAALDQLEREYRTASNLAADEHGRIVARFLCRDCKPGDGPGVLHLVRASSWGPVLIARHGHESHTADDVTAALAAAQVRDPSLRPYVEAHLLERRPTTMPPLTFPCPAHGDRIIDRKIAEAIIAGTTTRTSAPFKM